MKLRRTACFVALSLALYATAHAGEKDNGVYASLGIGTTSTNSASSGGLSSEISVGYAFNKNFSAEVYSLSAGSFDMFFLSDTYYPAQHTGIAAVGTLRFSESFRGFGRLGYGSTTMRSNKRSLPDYSNNDTSIGLGLSYDFSNRWFISLTTTHFNNTNFSNTSIGTGYRF